MGQIYVSMLMPLRNLFRSLTVLFELLIAGDGVAVISVRVVQDFLALLEDLTPDTPKPCSLKSCKVVIDAKKLKFILNLNEISNDENPRR